MKKPLLWQVEDIPKPHILKRYISKTENAVRKAYGGKMKTPVAKITAPMERSGAMGNGVQRAYQKRYGKKGQMNLPNLVVLFFVMVIILALTPALNDIIGDSAVSLLGNPNESTSITISIMRLMPFMLLVGVVLTVIYWSLPKQREGGY